jgi:type I restriction enzyme S subunit
MSSDWPAVPLGEVLTQVRDVVTIADSTVYKQVTVRLWGKGAVIRQEALGKEIKTKRQFRLRAGQLVYSRIDARLGAVALTPPDLDSAIVSTDFPVFDLVIDRIEPQFLNYFAQTRLFLDQCDRESLGTSKRTRIKEAEFLKIAIPLPPLDEQRWIVARLDALRVRVEQALALQGAAIAEAEALILANSATIFTRLVEKGVQMARIDDCCRIGTGLQKSPARRPKDRSTPYLRVANVQRNYLDLAEIKELEVTPDELERLRLLPGDVLVVEGNGSIDNIGRTALWRGEIENCVHQNHIIRLRPDIEAVIGEYVNAFLNSPLGRQQAAALSVTTSGLYVLSAGKVRQIQLPLPPIAEQQAVVAELEQMQSRVRRMIDLQVESESELAAMLPAALDRAFRGEL